MRRAITGFHRDREGHWVAELACGHGQLVRHEPPFQERPWVLEDGGRRARLGVELACMRCARGEPAVIYHVVPLASLRRALARATACETGTAKGGEDALRADEAYAPPSLATEGFVHCAGSRRTALAVARDLFAGCREPVVCLVIQTGRLGVPVRFEAPAPVPARGKTHLATATTFPHVYGPVDRRAICGAGILIRRGGRGPGFAWPERLQSLEVLLANTGAR